MVKRSFAFFFLAAASDSNQAALAAEFQALLATVWNFQL
jgi:hypothetical protein